MTRQTGAASARQSEGYVNDQPVALQVACWDLDLLTPDDVCALLKVKKSWLYDTVENGTIEAIRLGKQLRFRPSAVLHYLEERAINANAKQRSL